MEHISTGFLLSLLSIILIDILLAGDNAVVIAMAARVLPPDQRQRAILIGAGGAVVLRIVLTFFAARILELSFIKLLGGLLILWIAVKLLTTAPEDPDTTPQLHSLSHAIWTILVADLTMSLDNILAVAASSQGNLLLLGIGLALSITFVVFSSGLLARIMDRFPSIVWIGGAILGRVGGDMIVTDPWVRQRLNPSATLSVGFQLSAAAAVVIAGWAINRRRPSMG